VNLKANNEDGSHTGDLSFFQFMLSFTTIIGWLILFIFGGIGTIALPYEFISEFTNRPKKLEKFEFDKQKMLLLNYTMKLR
jgi:hypothetical protein